VEIDCGADIQCSSTIQTFSIREIFPSGAGVKSGNWLVLAKGRIHFHFLAFSRIFTTVKLPLPWIKRIGE
jgi:hypothetical protein